MDDTMKLYNGNCRIVVCARTTRALERSWEGVTQQRSMKGKPSNRPCRGAAPPPAGAFMNMRHSSNHQTIAEPHRSPQTETTGQEITHTVSSVLCIPKLCTKCEMSEIAAAQPVKNRRRGQQRMTAVAVIALASCDQNPPGACENGSTAFERWCVCSILCS
jgi:hypothetical protein